MTRVNATADDEFDENEDDFVSNEPPVGEPPGGLTGGVLRFASTVWRILTGPLRIADAVFAAVFRFVRLWWESRDWSGVRKGIPAVAGIVAVATAAIATNDLPTASVIADRYRMAAARALRHNDAETATLWLQKVAELTPHDPEVQFRIAETAARSGDFSRCMATMKLLAPHNAAGYAPAHAWLARVAVSQDHTMARAEYPVVEHHLVQALAGFADDTELRRVLVQLLIRQQRTDNAIEHLEILADQEPSALFGLAQLYAAVKKTDESRLAAQRGVEHFKTLVDDHPDNVDDRLQWARLEIWLEHFEQATEILSDGVRRLNAVQPAALETATATATAIVNSESASMPESQAVSGADNSIPDESSASVPESRLESRLVPDTDRLRVALAHAYYQWSLTVRQKSPDDVRQQLQLLLHAIDLAPDHPQLLEHLARFATVEVPETVEIDNILREALASGVATPITHMILGLAALSENTPDQAENHFRLAIEQNPRLMAAANNLAHILAHRDPPQLDEAERLIQLAIELKPDHPEVRETRGQIRALLGKTHEAINDLEFALARLGSRPAIHRTLATLYDALGDRVLADTHRRKAAEPALTGRTESDPAVDSDPVSPGSNP